MEEHIKSIYTLTDCDLMLEVNALKDILFITFQLFGKDRTPLDRFCEILKQENIPFTVSDMYKRYLPKIEFPR